MMKKKDFILFSSDSNELNGKDIKTIEGFEQIKNVENIEIYGINGLIDFSFLKNLPKLKYLHISGCSFSSFRFLSDLENIEVLELAIIPENKYNIQNETIDFSKLKKLKKNSYRDGLGKIPNFINVSSFPEIDLSNNNIYSISEEKITSLKSIFES